MHGERWVFGLALGLLLSTGGWGCPETDDDDGDDDAGDDDGGDDDGGDDDAGDDDAEGPEDCDPGQLWCGDECCAAAALTAGDDFTCALTDHGGVKCWGGNDNGQLGDGTQINRPVPGDVIGLESGVATITAGVFHACALTTAGGVKCWGWNQAGQIGIGSLADQLEPVDVVGLESGVAAVVAGGERTCALRTSGEMLCWGYVHSPGHEMLPTAAAGFSAGFSNPALGGYDALLCAIDANGGVACVEGEIDDSPQPIPGLSSGMSGVAVGDTFACALSAAGAVQCWGYNDQGQLGDGSWTNQDTPVPATGLDSGVQLLATGGYAHSCVVTTSNQLWCWGYNHNGQVGDGSTVEHGTPVEVTGLGSAVATANTGEEHTCAVTTEGLTYCWGYNWTGQCGSGIDKEETQADPEPIVPG